MIDEVHWKEVRSVMLEQMTKALNVSAGNSGFSFSEPVGAICRVDVTVRQESVHVTVAHQRRMVASAEWSLYNGLAGLRAFREQIGALIQFVGDESAGCSELLHVLRREVLAAHWDMEMAA